MSRLFAIAAIFCSAAAAETPVTGADLAAIRAVINQQIEAFRACAGRPLPPRAASPASVSFLEITVIGIKDVVQQVQVTDKAGAVWLAYYALQRQSDGSWRTSSCRLVEPKRTISAAYRPQ
jgi:Domain of unknown function (DUF4864)